MQIPPAPQIRSGYLIARIYLDGPAVVQISKLHQSESMVSITHAPVGRSLVRSQLRRLREPLQGALIVFAFVVPVAHVEMGPRVVGPEGQGRLILGFGF